MKNNKLFLKIYLFLLILCSLSLIVLSVLGNKNRIGYLGEFIFDEYQINNTLKLNGLLNIRDNFIIDGILDKKSIKNFIFTNDSITNYSYDFRIKYYDKVFRNSDIYGVYLDTNKIFQEHNFIKKIKMQKNGSPYGELISDKIINGEKIDNISYTLKVRNVITVTIIIMILMYLYLTFYKKLIIFYNFFINYKYFKLIFTLFSSIIILLIVSNLLLINYKFKSRLSYYDLVMKNNFDSIYKVKIDNYTDSNLFNINLKSISIIDYEDKSSFSIEDEELILRLENNIDIKTVSNSTVEYSIDINDILKNIVNIILYFYLIFICLILSKNNFIQKYYKYIFILIFSFISFPTISNILVANGLDPSWMYFINAADKLGFKFGKDIVFTYGFLGYLISPINLDNNLIISFIFKIIIYIIFILAIYKLIEKYDNLNIMFLIMPFLYYFSLGIFYSLFDYYISFLIAILLIIDSKSNYKYIPYIIAGILMAIAFFIKVSSGLLNVSMLIIYLVYVIIYRDKKSIINYSVILLFSLILIPVIYLIYNRNILDFYNYFKSSIEISSGYIYSMSVESKKWYNILIGYIFAIIYVYLIIYYFRKKDQKWLYMSLCGILFYLNFKHAFVRHDWIFAPPFLFISSILVLSTINEKTKLKLFIVIMIFAVSIINNVNIVNIFNFLFTGKYDSIAYSINKLNDNKQYESDRLIKLPNEMLSEISTNTVTIYPIEVSYVCNNNLNFKPMPIFQSYSIYTPYLDKLNSDFFDNENSPEYIIFEWGTIDRRLTLTDTPLTYQKIYNNYDVYDIYDGIYMLLKKREIKLNNNLQSNYTQKINIYEDKINIENITNDNTYLILKADMKLNIFGKIAKLVYQIPPISAEIETYSGKKYSFRILLPMLKNGMIINKLPTSLYEFESIFNNKMEDSVKTIRFYGKGLKLYKKKIYINIDIVEIK
ncbi:hypothetical protein SZ47_04735 [Brachyspira hyodysenteriae]|uniref:Uncharacterized protein n=1 Tax=Brachyspira hyodysenteriae ATCC 27164 TaxID=1266923 RepID=A0A3B6VS82_BRAHO|nr:hypothetical protein [Brachyspira hyodysenteriae]ANN63728.1 hypothetical protein BHYOB78_07580 [Brachyspira hyodysenteriae ATCC 27164]KLI27510.1 hypothetical protein SZ47_04735 [Brachyspira hyodysenteriae]MCZ9925167.1 hypothetical protein [Brachyspira hyodysenteriae]